MARPTERVRSARRQEHLLRRQSTGLASARTTAAVITSCILVWLLMRVVFFVGLTGSDDLRYVRFAATWDRVPVNTWEARLLGNSLTSLSMAAFGTSELALALPSLLASAVTLACVLYWCIRRQSLHYAWCAGMLVAVLPLDVEMATTVSPHTVMVGFMSLGTLLFIMHPEVPRLRRTASVLLGLGFVTHFAGVYYLAALSTAALVVDRHRYLRPVMTTVAACAILLGIEIAFYGVSFGEPLARFHACMAETGYVKPIMPHLADGSWNPEYFLWPVKNLLFSKAFGVALILVLAVGLIRIRSLESGERVLMLTTLLFWLWMSFGSEVPWRYVGFDRISRFLQPLTLALGVLFAVLIGTRRRWWFTTSLVTCVLVVCVMNLMGGGRWGQNVHLTKELLEYADENPGQTLLADYRTLNELYVLNGVQRVPNVVGLTTDHTSRLLNPAERLVSEDEAVQRVDAILVNAMNERHSPVLRDFVDRHAGAILFETKPLYRHICLLIPPLREHPWSLRKPPAIVRACRHDAADEKVARGE